MLREYLDDRTRYIYQQIYGNDTQKALRTALECVDEGCEMTDDVAQYMVDAMQVAVILCGDMGGENRVAITLLLPRRTPECFQSVSSRCHRNKGPMLAGDWILPGHDDEFPLFDLPIVHVWWREKFGRGDGNVPFVTRSASRACTPPGMYSGRPASAFACQSKYVTSRVSK